MIRTLTTIAIAIAGAGLVPAAAASAAPAAPSTPVPAGAGYVSSSAPFRSAAVTVRVPAIGCAKTSTQRSIEVGIFTTSAASGTSKPAAYSLTVQSSCRRGTSRYRALYRDAAGSGLRVHPGDRVRLTLDGLWNYEIDDLTSGAGTAGGIASSGHGPVAGRSVLIGVQRSAAAPHRITAVLAAAAVNHKALGAVPHHRQVPGGGVHVSPLSESGFRLTLA